MEFLKKFRGYYKMIKTFFLMKRYKIRYFCRNCRRFANGKYKILEKKITRLDPLSIFICSISISHFLNWKKIIRWNDMKKHKHIRFQLDALSVYNLHNNYFSFV